MKSLLSLFAATILFVALCTANLLRHGSTNAQNNPPNTNRTPVVVELFTSEGCSSCPPADTLLAELESKQPFAQGEVIALEEHVDYWDQLGWRDPFSSSDWTDRQRQYATALGSGGLYTPQMIVNGTTEFVGSRSRQAFDTINKAANTKTADVFLASNPDNSTGMPQLSIHVKKLTKEFDNSNVEVWLALTESGLHSAVTRGENAGEDLHHSSILRTLRRLGNIDSSKDPSFAEDITISIDSKWKRENLRAVVFLQEKKTRRILGAATLRLQPSHSA